MQFYNTHVYNLEDAIIASGLPMTTSFNPTEFDIQCLKLAKAIKENDYDNKDLKRAFKLAKTETGSGHSNFCKGILVSTNVTMNLKVMKQFQRYIFAPITSSQSTMHRITKMNLDECFDQFTTIKSINILKKLVAIYNENPTNENFEILTSNIPSGLLLTFHFTTNYMCLRNIYNQRKNHKLKAEWQPFCQWVALLPLAKELILTCI